MWLCFTSPVLRAPRKHTYHTRENSSFKSWNLSVREHRPDSMSEIYNPSPFVSFLFPSTWTIDLIFRMRLISLTVIWKALVTALQQGISSHTICDIPNPASPLDWLVSLDRADALVISMVQLNAEVYINDDRFIWIFSIWFPTHDLSRGRAVWVLEILHKTPYEEYSREPERQDEI